MRNRPSLAIVVDEIFFDQARPIVDAPPAPVGAAPLGETYPPPPRGRCGLRHPSPPPGVFAPVYLPWAQASA